MTALYVWLIGLFGTSAYVASAKESPTGQDIHPSHSEALQVIDQWRVKYKLPTDEEMHNQEQKHYLDRP